MMTIKVFIATDEDYLPVNELVKEGHEEHVMEEPTIFKSVESVMPETYYKELIGNEVSDILIAKEDEIVVGFAVISVETSPPFESLVPRKYAYIHDFGVKAELQRKGIGKILFTACITWAKEREVNSIELNVWEFNTKAIEFYKHFEMNSVSRKMKLNI
ncbi:GNAT family N-acetyltransferase [Lysinibacillus sp. Ag94]|uniref:GNAT family N-acetyltransferase n=1 Tax=Lysinibacillus sp. Ag94 TaxID=2936682 RepID=UPI00200EF889|nr:GNAT family N-acetyltransferase [Lysinibacillus sp. Ag94]UPW85208.1 GNAT family N-acetyltransferase [Lysinibacillus sp. Ag94]